MCPGDHHSRSIILTIPALPIARSDTIRAELNVAQLHTDAELQLRAKLLDGGLEDLRRREAAVVAEEARLHAEEARLKELEASFRDVEGIVRQVGMHNSLRS